MVHDMHGRRIQPESDKQVEIGANRVSGASQTTGGRKTTRAGQTIDEHEAMSMPDARSVMYDPARPGDGVDPARREQLLAGLNPAQREAVLTTEGPLLVIAGAGSGKTRVLTHRIAYLLLKGVRAEHILAITFTNKAAREMKERTEKLVGEAAKRVWLFTFHAWAARLLRMEHEAVGVNADFTIYDADDAERLLKNVIRARNLDEKKFPPRVIKGKISKLKNEGTTSRAFYDQAHTFEQKKLAELYLAYDEALKAQQALDFDDLLLYTLVLFRTRPDILEKYQERHRYILIDEYQDTNRVQYELVRLLGGRYQNVCAVGDGDQSIYKWRGADVRNLLAFERDFKHVQTILLEENYRSTRLILHSANHVIAKNRVRKPKQLWTSNAYGEKIALYIAYNENDEGRFIAEEIQKLKSAGRRYQDIAVLYRMNAQSQPIERALALSGIPYRVVGGLKFYERKEIKDVLAYLRLLANPYDAVSLSRIINTPRRGIGEASVERLSLLAKESRASLLTLLKDAPRYGFKNPIAARLRSFAEMMEALRTVASQGMPLSAFIEKVLTESGYLSMLEEEAVDDQGAGRLENVQQFVSQAKMYEEETEGADLFTFLADIALVSDLDALDTAADAVTLMTLHSAKGLEYPVVFMPGLEEGLFPTYRAVTSGEEDDIEEERRLMYVGITRARDRLYLSYATSRTLFGRTNPTQPSRFVGELPEEALELIEDKPQDTGIWGTERRGVSHRDDDRKRAGWQDTGRKSAERQMGPLRSNHGALKEADVTVGDRVRHQKWGEGTIVQIKESAGDTLLMIAFAAPHGVKQLSKAYAPLEKL